MTWNYMIAYFFGGALISNAIPHWVRGVMGQSFQSPFAKPSGIGLSSATVNVLWGAFNFIVGYVLLVKVGTFDLHDATNAGSAGLGLLVMGLFAARHFGKFHGGATPG